MYDINDGDDFSALEAGTAYALYRHGQDRQTAQITSALLNQQHQHDADPVHVEVEVHLHTDDEPDEAPINALDYTTADMPDDWNDYIGQEPLKKQISVYMNSAKMRKARLPHMLLASGYPGVGKTTMARLVAKSLGVDIYELVPPFKISTLVTAAQTLNDRDILFIDEIHKLADTSTAGAEILLKVLEDGVAIVDGEAVQLPDITIVGATTEPDKLPTPVLDRFKIKPYFQAYDNGDLGEIAITFAYKHRARDYVDPVMALAFAKACRGTPRITEEMVMAARDVGLSLGRMATPDEVLSFLEVEADGLTRTHIHYLTAMRQYFGRTKPKSEDIEYIVGEAAIMQILRETKPGIQRIEGFLVERGLIDRTPRGRRLTDRGIQRAEQFIAAGKGAADVA